MLKSNMSGDYIIYNSKKQSPANTVGASIYLNSEESADYTQQYIRNQIIGTKNPKIRIKNILKEIKNEYEDQHEIGEGMKQLKKTMQDLLVIADLL
jgi:hypothetical protein